MKRKFSICFFLFFFIFSEKLYAETISTAQTADSTKTTTEDITVTSTGSYTCSTVSNCIKFNGDNLTLDNSGTITHDTADKDNVIRFAPPLIITFKEAEEAVKIIAKTFKELYD